MEYYSNGVITGMQKDRDKWWLEGGHYSWICFPSFLGVFSFLFFAFPTTKPSQPVHYHKNDCRVPYRALLRGEDRFETCSPLFTIRLTGCSDWPRE